MRKKKRKIGKMRVKKRRRMRVKKVKQDGRCGK